MKRQTREYPTCNSGESPQDRRALDLQPASGSGGAVAHEVFGEVEIREGLEDVERCVLSDQAHDLGLGKVTVLLAWRGQLVRWGDLGTTRTACRA